MAEIEAGIEYNEIIDDENEDEEEEEEEDSEDLVHVKGYRRNNGTYVDDYYRSAPGSGSDDFFEEDFSDMGFSKSKIKDIYFSIYENTINSRKERYNPPKSHIKNILKDWQNYLEKASAELKSILERISKNSNNKTHQKLLSKYMVKKENLRIESEQYNFIKHNFDNGKYDNIEVSSLFPQGYITNLNPQGATSKNESYNNQFAGMSVPKNLGDRILFDFAKTVDYPKYPISTEFAHNSLTWLQEINKNPDANLINSTRDIENPYLQRYLQDNIQRTLYRPDARGVFYSNNSDVARKIALSPEFQRTIYNNANKLLKNTAITSEPLDFRNNADLANSLGHANIYKAWIDKDGSLNAIIFDIYDFKDIENPQTDKERMNNQMFHWQINKNIENYFVLIYVKI